MQKIKSARPPIASAIVACTGGNCPEKLRCERYAKASQLMADNFMDPPYYYATRAVGEAGCNATPEEWRCPEFIEIHRP